MVDCIAEYGNTSAATLPLALAFSERDGLLEPGDRVLLGAFGAGFTWGATVIEWGRPMSSCARSMLRDQRTDPRRQRPPHPARSGSSSLCDPGTLQLIRSEVISLAMGERARPGDGVLGGSGLVDGPARVLLRAGRVVRRRLAGRGARRHDHRACWSSPTAAAPRWSGSSSSGGARMQEGIAALGGYGRIFRRTVALSGRVPQISIVTGLSAGGGAYSPALTDWVVMTEESSMFLTGPGGRPRGARRGCRRRSSSAGRACTSATASATSSRRDDFDAARAGARAARLPAQPPRLRAAARPSRGRPAATTLRRWCPREARKVYDVRDVIRALVDDGELLEVSAGWARNLVTAMARIDGRPVGVIANQPRYLGGVLDAASSEKGARFVSKCNSFGIPLLVLVDTPGYMPGTRQESAGVIRHGATLVHAFAEATVPRVTVILRKAFGGAFITMNSKDLGADYVFAWPEAEIGVMGARPAVGVIHRRELAAAEDPEAERERLADEYAHQQLRPQVAATTGYVDELIAPVTRAPGWRGRSRSLDGRAAMSLRRARRVLLTGATGFVGMEVLARYLERSERRIVTLVRAADDGRPRRGSTACSTNLFGARADQLRAVASTRSPPI